MIGTKINYERNILKVFVYNIILSSICKKNCVGIGYIIYINKENFIMKPIYSTLYIKPIHFSSVSQSIGKWEKIKLFGSLDFLHDYI